MRSITRRCVAVGVGLSLAAPLLAPAPGGALSFADPVGSAVDWLETQQQDDGSFEVAQFPGFETSDAIAAIAAASQTGPRWDDAQALAAVEALVSTQTRTPLDEIDRLVDADGAADPSTDAAGARAAKVIVLVAGPLGLDPTDVDPADDSPAAVDLGARMDLHRQGDGSYDFGAQFNGLLYTAIALGNVGSVPAAVVDQIEAAQRPDGSWDYTGTTTADDGRFVLKPLQPGLYDVHISFVGLKPYVKQAVRVNPEKIALLGELQMLSNTDLPMVEVFYDKWTPPLIDPEEPGKLTIVASQFEDNPQRKTPVSLIASSSPDIYQKPGTDELYFRGSRSENMVYFVDGVKIPGRLSGVPPVSIASMTIYTGGLPARYGDVTGGVVAIETKSYYDLYLQRKAGIR